MQTAIVPNTGGRRPGNDIASIAAQSRRLKYSSLPAQKVVGGAGRGRILNCKLGQVEALNAYILTTTTWIR